MIMYKVKKDVTRKLMVMVKFSANEITAKD